MARHLSPTITSPTKTMTKCTPKSVHWVHSECAPNLWPGLWWCTRGVRRPVGQELIRFHPFGKFIDNSRRNCETHFPEMIRLITFGPTTVGRKELMRRRGGDRRHPHLLRAPIIASNSFERSGPHATPRWRPKTPAFASSTNYNIQAVRPVEAEGGTEVSSNENPPTHLEK